jgi:glutathione S-transferase
MLKIYGRRTSSNLQAVMWVVAELGLQYERVEAGGKYGVVDTPEYRAMNPNGLVPVVIDGDDEPLFESCAINRYLASRYGSAPFWPEDLSKRAQIDKWAEWAKVTFAPGFLGPVFGQLMRVRPADQDREAIAAAVNAMRRNLEIAEAQLEKHSFLAGPDLTLADIPFGGLLYRYFTLEIERPDLPKIAAYYERLTENPHYREHVMVSYEELRVK